MPMPLKLCDLNVEYRLNYTKGLINNLFDYYSLRFPIGIGLNPSNPDET